MGKVKDKILKEAEEKKKKIEKDTLAEIQKIIEEAKKEASSIEKKGKETAKEEEKIEMESPFINLNSTVEKDRKQLSDLIKGTFSGLAATK